MERQFKSSKGLFIGATAGLCSLISSVFLFAAPADTIGVKKARELIQNLAGANLNKNQVEIKDISSGVADGGVIVEARIDTTFRMAKDNGDWRISDVRLGDRQWESFELIDEALRREKMRRTTVLLKQLTDGLTAYQRDRGRFVETEKMGELLDYLSPRYIATPFRFDLWGKEFEYKGTATGYRLISAGPDRKQGTPDDLVVENGVMRSVTEYFSVFSFKFSADGIVTEN